MYQTERGNRTVEVEEEEEEEEEEMAEKRALVVCSGWAWKERAGGHSHKQFFWVVYCTSRKGIKWFFLTFCAFFHRGKQLFIHASISTIAMTLTYLSVFPHP